VITIKTLTTLDVLLKEHTVRDVAKYLDCNLATVYRWRNASPPALVTPEGILYTPAIRHVDSKGFNC
jgi:hypothetical protein